MKESGMFVGALDRLVNTLAVLAGLMMVALTALICVDVTARYFRLLSMPWSLDAAKYLLYGITFFGAPWVLRDGGHITVDLFVERLGAGSRATCQKITNILGAIICIILTYYACRTMYGSMVQNVMINETFVFPEWWLFAVAPPIFFILFLVFVRFLVDPEHAGTSTDKQPEGF